MKPDQNCISYWYPRLLEANVPTPATEIVKTRLGLTGMVFSRCFSSKEFRAFEGFIASLVDAATRLPGASYPVFLRSGHTAIKHGWASTCLIKAPGEFGAHVSEIVGESSLLGDFGLSVNVWAVREMLPTQSSFTAFNGGLPISKERRYFVRDGQAEFHHPYWPPAAIYDASVENWRDLLDELNRETPEEIAELSTLTERVGKVLPGYWSVDWLWTTDGRGWVCTDMALGHHSFKWTEYSGSMS